MAFAIRNLSVLAYANGFTLWHYRGAEEPLAAINAAGFFADAADMLCTGDIVMVSAQEGARILAVADAIAAIPGGAISGAAIPGAAKPAARRAGPPRTGTVSLVPLA